MRKGTTHSSRTKKQIAATLRGRKVSRRTRERMSAARREFLKRSKR